MSQQLYRLVYCSRNRIRGTEAEVTAELQTILASSRKNNSAVEVTGALLYNDGNFAQALEGPLAAVERTFERIQRDLRHSEVTIVESMITADRLFPDWSMAFSGGNTNTDGPRADAAFQAAFGKSEKAGDEVMAVLRDLVVQEDDWLEVA